MNSQSCPQFKVLALYLPYVRPLLSKAIHVVFSLFFSTPTTNLFIQWILVVVSHLERVHVERYRTEILLFYLVVDEIVIPVDFASGKSSRCSEMRMGFA
jgi:hypothetical protein